MSTTEPADKRRKEAFPPVGGRSEGMCSALLCGRPSVGGGYGAVLGVLGAALVCRAGAALWWGDLLWADSVFYRQIALALEKGDFTEAFALLGLNLYPVVLMWLDRLGAWVGADWTVVGKWWSVAIGSLAVLPFYGWVRRLFNDRIAFWAGLFFAIHPHLVGHSPLIIRDPTYWFLFNLALYLSWRAVAETRLGLFLAAGAAVGLAMYTRIEGVLLVGVLLGWALCRAIGVRQGRVLVLLGALLALAVIPAGVAAVNLTWLREHPQWEWGRLPLFFRIWDWAAERLEDIFSLESGGLLYRHKNINDDMYISPSGTLSVDNLAGLQQPVMTKKQPYSCVPTASLSFPRPLANPPPMFAFQLVPGELSISQTPKPTINQYPASPLPAQKAKTSTALLSATSPVSQRSNSGCRESLPMAAPAELAAGNPIGKVSEWVQGRRVALRLIKALSYPYALLIGVGLVCAWRILLRSDQIVVSAHNLLLFLATWGYQSLSLGIDFRYFFPILFTALPYAALGFEAMRKRLRRADDSEGNAGLSRPWGAIGAAGGVLLLLGLGVFEVQPPAVKLMRQQSALGQWIVHNWGSGTRIFCTESASILLAYHAQAECRSWPPQADAEYDEVRQLFLEYLPDVVVLWDDPIYPDPRWMEVVKQVCQEIGYQKTPAELLPEEARRCDVWIRPRNGTGSEEETLPPVPSQKSLRLYRKPTAPSFIGSAPLAISSNFRCTKPANRLPSVRLASVDPAPLLSAQEIKHFIKRNGGGGGKR